MAEIVRMPKLSDTMEEGVVAEWHKKVGDKVESGDLLAEIETDKATMEFESFQDGTLLHIGVDTGDSAPVDSILAILGEEGEDIEELLEEEKKSESKKSEKKEDKDEEKEDSSEEDEEKEKDDDEQKSESKEAPKKSSESSKTSSGRIKASPLAKKLAADKGVDISEVKGSGEGGRIIKRDIENFKGSEKPKASAAAASAPVGEESFREEPISQMRKTIAKRLSESKFTAPHFYLTMEIDMENAMASRKAINTAIEPEKISFNDMVIKAAAAALKKHPKVNASWTGDKIRIAEHVHIGVAVAVEEGLLVPVVRFADTKPMVTINEEVKNFAEKARNKKLQPQDWEGNTFTISNLGMFGIE
ncbi:MAG: 2-oxo acid dehydrogenase subunit E2, partial [Flavobacteriales bacterium]|nr:2-oxo acid dehydrogenase subunit E2 [Flavobacteriales bacterium]